MCGILGFLGHISKDRFVSAINKQKHRGPDDWGYLQVDNLHLGHRRLSIIDLHQHAKQPMLAGNGSIIGVFNGEIYNYKKLRTKLEAIGYIFRTKSDTEVLLNAYHFYGIEVLQKLNGMFAFAIYDKRNHEIFIARDRLGIKPLYFTSYKSTFCFSSEVKSIIALDNESRDLNLRAVSSYLSYRYPIMNESFYKGIKMLPPGSYLRISSDNKIKVTRYWTLADKLSLQKIDRGEGYYIKELQRLFESAVKYRMVADVPVGAYLSGGVDSSAIVAKMATLSRCPIKTFTIGFGEQGYNEFLYARSVAEQYGTEHHEINLSPAGYFEALSDLVRFKDAPLGVPNEVPLYLMSKELKKYVTVVLSGEGADEIFGGYGRIFRSADDFAKYKLWRNTNSTELSSVLKKKLFDKYGDICFENEVNHFLYLYRYTSKNMKEKILSDRFISQNFDSDFDLKFADIFLEVENFDYIDKMMYTFENIHLPGLLQRVDVTTMATSVEARVPFVDHRLVEFAFTIPNKYKLKWNCDPSSVYNLLGVDISEKYDIPKYILKKAFEPLLHKDILYRKKIGFPVPLHRWFGGEFRNIAESKILNGFLVDQNIINKKNVTLLIKNPKLLEDYSLAMKVWMLLNLEVFLENF